MRDSQGSPERLRSRVASLQPHGRLDDRISYAAAYLPFDQFGWAPLYSVCSSHAKYIEAPKAELYDLRSDPHELVNEHAAGGDTLRRLKSELRRLRAGGEWADTDRGEAMDPETLAKLRALGYVQGDGTPTEVTGADPKDKIDISEGRERANQLMDQGRYAESIVEEARVAIERPRAHPSESRRNSVACSSMQGPCMTMIRCGSHESTSRSAAAILFRRNVGRRKRAVEPRGARTWFAAAK